MLFICCLIAAYFPLGLSGQSCLSGGMTFSTQEAIDNFSANFPDCNSISGTVTIEESSPGAIENLAGLSAINSIGEALVINQNTALSSLEGLNNITTVGGRLTISNNPLLEHLQGLEALDTIVSSLRISNNAALSSLTGLGDLQYLFQDLSIENNKSLNNLRGLDSLRHIDGQVNISSNPRLTSLEGLDQLQDVSHTFQLYNNPLLQSLEALASLQSVGGDFIIDEHQRLPTLQGLEGLESVGGFLQIVNQPILNNLIGLRGLKQVGGLLQVFNNKLLSSLSGLDSIDHESFNSLALISNPNLTECSVKSICDYLAETDPVHSISGNRSGCLTTTQILAACKRQGQNSQPGQSNDILLFPNPTKGKVFIKGRTIEGAQVLLYDTAGRKISTRTVEGQTFNIEALAVGFYRLRIFAGDRVFNKSLIKMD